MYLVNLASPILLLCLFAILGYRCPAKGRVFRLAGLTVMTLGVFGLYLLYFSFPADMSTSDLPAWAIVAAVVTHLVFIGGMVLDLLGMIAGWRCEGRRPNHGVEADRDA